MKVLVASTLVTFWYEPMQLALLCVLIYGGIWALHGVSCITGSPWYGNTIQNIKMNIFFFGMFLNYCIIWNVTEFTTIVYTMANSNFIAWMNLIVLFILILLSLIDICWNGEFNNPFNQGAYDPTKKNRGSNYLTNGRNAKKYQEWERINCSKDIDWNLFSKDNEIERALIIARGNYFPTDEVDNELSEGQENSIRDSFRDAQFKIQKHIDNKEGHVNF